MWKDLATKIKNIIIPQAYAPGLSTKQQISGINSSMKPQLDYFAAKNKAGEANKTPSNFTPKTISYSGLDKLGHNTPYAKPTQMPKIATQIKNTIPKATPMATPKITPIMFAPQAVQYQDLINKSATDNGIPPKVLYKVLDKESMHFNPDVISGKLASPAGAQGIAQFMPATAKGMGLNPLDPNQAIPAAAKYLKAKLVQHGTLEKALAAYNAGSGNVDKYGGIPPFLETQNYVKDIMKYYYGN